MFCVLYCRIVLCLELLSFYEQDNFVNVERQLGQQQDQNIGKLSFDESLFDFSVHTFFKKSSWNNAQSIERIDKVTHLNENFPWWKHIIKSKSSTLRMSFPQSFQIQYFMTDYINYHYQGNTWKSGHYHLMPCFDWFEGFLHALEQVPGKTVVYADKRILENSKGYLIGAIEVAQVIILILKYCLFAAP